jgi:hypothetical protein
MTEKPENYTIDWGAPGSSRPTLDKPFTLKTIEVDPETGASTSKVLYNPTFVRFFVQFDQVKRMAKQLSIQYPEDKEVLDSIYDIMNKASMKLKSYLTKKYPGWRKLQK